MLKTLEQTPYHAEAVALQEGSPRNRLDNRAHRLLQEAQYTYLFHAIMAIPPSPFKEKAGPYLRSGHFVDAMLNHIDPQGRSGFFGFVESNRTYTDEPVPFGAEVYFQAQALTADIPFSPDQLDTSSLEHYQKVMTYLSKLVAKNEIVRTEAAKLLGHHLASHYSEVSIAAEKEPILDNPFPLRIDESGIFCSSKPSSNRRLSEVHTPFRSSSDQRPTTLFIGGGLSTIPFAEANDVLPTTNHLYGIEPDSATVMNEFLKLRRIENARVATLPELEQIVPETSLIMLNDTLAVTNPKQLHDLLSLIHGVTSKMARPPRVVVQEHHLTRQDQALSVIKAHELVFHRPVFKRKGEKHQMRAFSYLPHLYEEDYKT